jgi:outer membrane biogenesis lipoprotein LolB
MRTLTLIFTSLLLTACSVGREYMPPRRCTQRKRI